MSTDVGGSVISWWLNVKENALAISYPSEMSGEEITKLQSDSSTPDLQCIPLKYDIKCI